MVIFECSRCMVCERLLFSLLRWITLHTNIQTVGTLVSAEAVVVTVEKFSFVSPAVHS